MLIKDIILLIEKLNKDGKYVTLDDTLYRSVGLNELSSILDKGGFEPNMLNANKPLSSRADSLEYDFWTEEDKIKADYEGENDVYIKRKMDIGNKFKYPHFSKSDDKETRNKKKQLRQKYNKIYGIKPGDKRPEYIGFYKSFSRSLNDSLARNFNLNKNKLTIEFYKEPLKNLQGAKLVPFGWLKNFYDNRPNPGGQYISDKNELEDRLYYTSNFLKFKGPLNKYIKRVYIDENQFDEDNKPKLGELINKLFKAKIEIRQYDRTKKMYHHLDKVKPDPITGKKEPPTLETHPEFFTPNELRRGSSSDYEIASRALPPEPDKNKDSITHKKWIKQKERQKKFKEKINNSNPIDYFKLNAFGK